ncbi:MAG: 23S rRNA (uracil(1939)-C(5))-methyltransferase RlmD [Clostridiales bacterium]|nr:23S rRNA (uracil(1939)-C(5))-methyltransferase RlmD [Clostridiales bacterium]
MKKGQEFEGYVSGLEFPNKGIVEIEDRKVIVKNALPGQKVKFRINKLRKSKVEGRLVEVLENSHLEDREAKCIHFGPCGGCSYQNLSYKNQLELKKKQVKSLIDKVCDDYIFEGIIGSPNEWAYRNKMEFSFGDEEKDGPLTLGLHKRGSFYDVITTDKCQIVDVDYNKILACVLDYFGKLGINYYKKMSRVGYLRHLLVRRATKTGEILVNLITTSQWDYEIPEAEVLENFKNELLKLELNGEIVGILHTYNDTIGDVVQKDSMKTLYGQEYFYEEILGLKFQISSFSFFQTNSLGAELLYQKAREYVLSPSSKDENVMENDGRQDKEMADATLFDLYSGTGTIAQILAPVAKKVIGIEIVEEAVEAAKENASLNGLDNCEFIAGDVLKVLDDVEEKPDLIVLDPPRDGVHPKALNKIIDYGVDRIVYISCKPTSLVRDLVVLQDRGYKVEKVCAVDLFPQTPHVEVVVTLKKDRV